MSGCRMDSTWSFHSGQVGPCDLEIEGRLAQGLVLLGEGVAGAGIGRQHGVYGLKMPNFPRESSLHPRYPNQPKLTRLVSTLVSTFRGQEHATELRLFARWQAWDNIYPRRCERPIRGFGAILRIRVIPILRPRRYGCFRGRLH